MSDFPYKVEAIGKLEKGHVRKYESSDEFLEYKKSKLSEVLA